MAFAGYLVNTISFYSINLLRCQNFHETKYDHSINQAIKWKMYTSARSYSFHFPNPHAKKFTRK